MNVALQAASIEILTVDLSTRQWICFVFLCVPTSVTEENKLLSVLFSTYAF